MYRVPPRHFLDLQSISFDQPGGRDSRKCYALVVPEEGTFKSRMYFYSELIVKSQITTLKGRADGRMSRIRTTRL